MEEPKIGIGAIVINKNQTLLGRRKNAHGEGLYAAPGGHLEFGEDPIECAKRELLEETGLIALSTQVGPWLNNVIDNKHYVTLIIFITEFVGKPEVLEPNKCESWNWFDLEKMPTPLFPPLITLIEKHSSCLSQFKGEKLCKK